MTYNKNVWENRVPPRINATNLNKMETGIEEAHDDIATLNAALVTDLISGVTPTFSGWTVDPTDAADIIDGDISTICTTGNKVAAGGYQYAFFEWDIGSFKNVLVTGVGGVGATAGSKLITFQSWNGTAWISSTDFICNTSSVVNFYVMGSYGSKFRIGLGASAAATITPNIREFHVWRL
jgi:hypothetical protein